MSNLTYLTPAELSESEKFLRAKVLQLTHRQNDAIEAGDFELTSRLESELLSAYDALDAIAETEAPTAAEAWGDEADINYHDDVPEWAQGIRADY